MMVRAQSPDPDLTPRQRKIIQVIEESVRRYGYGPTVREIGEAVGLASTSSVTHQLSVLAKKGYLSRGPGRPRTAVVQQPRVPPVPQRAAQPGAHAPGPTTPHLPPIAR